MQVLPKDIRAKLTDPQEVIPIGNEIIRNIKHVIVSDKGVPLWSVFFKGSKKIFMIRESVVTYYWPVEAALFTTKLVAREQKRKRYFEKLLAAGELWINDVISWGFNDFREFVIMSAECVVSIRPFSFVINC